MKILATVIAFFIFCSCNNQSGIGKKLSDGDSIAIDFTDSITGAISKTVAATDANAISRLSQFIDAKTTEIFKCGYDGNLRFFKNDSLLGEVSFKYSNAECRHFLFQHKGKLVSTAMSHEASYFLEGLAEGRTTY